MNMDKYFMWIHYERLHNHNKAKHNKTVCIFLGIYCIVIAYKQYMNFTFFSGNMAYLQSDGQVNNIKTIYIYTYIISGVHKVSG